MYRHEPGLKETHIIGASTRSWIVRAEDCPLLMTHHLKHVEIFDAASPFRMVRRDPDGSFLLASFAGKGKILLDGRWQICRAGTASLVPPHVLDAFNAVPGSRWGICCVRYLEPGDQLPIVTAHSPVLSRCNAEPLRLAILGLHYEIHHGQDAAATRHWVELIHRYALQMTRPFQLDRRLWRLWEQVENQLAHPWSRGELSRLSHMSNEHLRRICRRQLGRSPMQQVTYLRIQRAAELLETTNDKIETIGAAIGYQNAFVFSNTFKKWTGWRPSEYRWRKLQQ